MTTKTKRGGARAGSGRKPEFGTKVTVRSAMTTSRSPRRSAAATCRWECAGP